MTRAAPVLLALAGCGGEEPAAREPREASPLRELPPNAILTRLSLDLRGVRPTEAELAKVEADPAALDDLLEAYLHDARFEARVADLWSEVWLTRTEQFNVNFEGFDLEGLALADVFASVGDQPPRTMGYLAAHDLPITDLVTADWTVADPAIARVWPVDYPPGGAGWQQVRWTDGRPPAGVLASNTLYWRYPSTDSNANRKRANQVSRILLCNDYLVRPIDFDRNVNLLDEAALADALRTNDGCVACHASLDPLSAYFFGFWTFEFTATEVSHYHPAREALWRQALGTPPAFYGEPGSDLSDLGWQIASDERFPQCVVEQATELLLRRDARLLDADRLTAHREALLDGGLAIRPLLASIVRSPEYRSAEDDADGLTVPRKLVTPDLLATSVADLTGFRWALADGTDLLRTDLAGFQTLAGGADGLSVTASARASNATSALVVERLAESAADFVVSQELADPGSTRLLGGQDLSSTDDAVVGARLVTLHHALFGHVVAPDGPEVDAGLALFHELVALDGDVPRAWAGLLSALLRDPDFLLY